MDPQLIASWGYHVPGQDLGQPDLHFIPTWGYVVDEEGARLRAVDQTPRFKVKVTVAAE